VVRGHKFVEVLRFSTREQFVDLVLATRVEADPLRDNLQIWFANLLRYCKFKPPLKWPLLGEQDPLCDKEKGHMFSM
jgi:hypothetical protein